MIKLSTALLIAAAASMRVKLDKTEIGSEQAKSLRKSHFNQKFVAQNSRQQKSKRERAAKQKKSLRDGKKINFGSEVYTADVYVGSGYHTSTMMFDTMAVSTSFESITCTNCLGTSLFDSNASTSYVETNSESTHEFGSNYYYYAVQGTDTICLTDSSVTTPADIYCADTMPLDLITSAYEMPENVDGILGLGYWGEEGGQLARQFVPEFIDNVQTTQGTFSSNIFAFGYDYFNDNTFVDLGEVDTSAYTADEAVILELHETESINHWNLQSRGVMFIDEEGNKSQYSWYDHNVPEYDTENDFKALKNRKVKAKKNKKLKDDDHDHDHDDDEYGYENSYPEEIVLIDSTLADRIEIPWSDWNKDDQSVFLSELLGDRDHESIYSQEYYGDKTWVYCDDSFNSFYIMINNYWLEISPEQYLKESDEYSFNYGWDSDETFDCYINIEEGWSLTLGPLALDGYYVIHDQDEEQITIAPLVGGGRAELEEWDGGYLEPLPNLSNRDDLEFSLMNLVFQVGVLAVWYFLFTGNIFPEPSPSTVIFQSKKGSKEASVKLQSSKLNDSGDLSSRLVIITI